MRIRLGRIERYVLAQQFRALAVALAIISALVMLIDFVEVSRGLNSSGELSSARIFGLVLLKSPTVVVQLLPFVFLFGTLAAFVGLNRRSELIAMRAAGISAWRFVLPAAGAALVHLDAGRLVIPEGKRHSRARVGTAHHAARRAGGKTVAGHGTAAVDIAGTASRHAPADQPAQVFMD